MDDKLQLKREQVQSVENAMAEFKRELRTASKNELVRMCANFYVSLTIFQFQINDMDTVNKSLSKQLSELNKSKESHE